jgi:hypothetical protein
MFRSVSAVVRSRSTRRCRLDQGEHLSVVYDQIALREMLNALDPTDAQTPACVPIAPVVGG